MALFLIEEKEMSDDSPPRLNPQAVLKRFQLLKTATVYNHLYGYHLLNQVDKFQGQAGLLQVPGGDGDWEKALSCLCTLAARLNWFAVDWDVIDDLWRMGMELGEEEQFHIASHFLYLLPLRLFGWSPEALWENDLAAKLRAILVSEDESPLKLPFEWGEADKVRAWARLENIERNPGHYPGPVHRLPAICRWVAHRSGNFILDTYLNPYEYHPVCISFAEGAGTPSVNWYTWQPDDLQKVRVTWQKAQPVIESYDRLEEWCGYDEDNVSKLLHFIQTGCGSTELTW